MAIVYKNGRLVRESSTTTTTTTTTPSSGGSGGFSPEEIAAAIDIYEQNKKPPSGGAVQPDLPPLTPEQQKSRLAFEKNAAAEGEARMLALKADEKARTAWGKEDADGDGIPNSIDKSNSPPQGGGGGKGNTNMATNTPIKSYIANQLRMSGLPDTPANRAMLRKEYLANETAAAKETVKANEATAKATEDAADNQAAYDAIMKSIGGYETRAGTAKTDAMKRLADLYDPQVAALDTQKQEQLDYLQQVLSQAGTDINASEKNFLSRLITPSAYTDVPLLNIPQQQNALMTALQSQGADTGQVAAQSASDAAVNDFMKQLISRSNTQYGNAQTNYVDALRNAGMGAAKSGRDYLALEQPRLQSGINTKFADALASLNTNRTSAEGDIMDTFQKALDNAAEIKTKGETDYPLASRPTATPAVAPMDAPVDASVDEMGMSAAERKRLQEALAGMFSSNNIGQGFLTR
jgi:hypothetical protein